MYSPSIQNLLKQLKKLPTVGQHTAEKFLFHWLKSGKKEATELLIAIKELIDNVKSCETCWDFSDSNPCPICADPRRDQTIICVVANPPELVALEKTKHYHGRYHVLRGTIESNDHEELNKTKIPELFTRIKKQEAGIKEVIIALNPDLPGETTRLYLEQAIKKINPTLKITRLARGLPMGSDLQYADEITLGNALKGRTEK